MISKFPFPENVSSAGRSLLSKDVTLMCAEPLLSPLKRSALATYFSTPLVSFKFTRLDTDKLSTLLIFIKKNLT